MTAVETPAIHFEGDGAFGYDPRVAVEHLRADPALARLVEKVGPFRMELKRTPSIFVALTEAIVYQQLHGKAAATIYGRLCALFPGAAVDGPTAEQILSATDDQLRGAGLSRSKMLSIQDLARHARDGEIPTLAQAHAMGDDEIVERLSVVRGIGRWTVEMLLIFRLGRPDVLPVDDFGVRKGFWFAFKKRGEPDRKVLQAHGERWRPYRSVASWYLWRAAAMAPRPKAPVTKAPVKAKKAAPARKKAKKKARGR
jgi:3-methyladenine DNA glycosylase/8-oxoguanine DNA glycosylase